MSGPLDEEAASVAVTAFTRDVDDVVARGRSWAGEPEAFFWFLDQVADLCVRGAALEPALRSAGPEAMAARHRAVLEAGGQALSAAQSAGLVRADLKAQDMAAIVNLLSAGLSGDLAQRQAMSLRTREIVLSGLKAHR